MYLSNQWIVIKPKEDMMCSILHILKQWYTWISSLAQPLNIYQQIPSTLIQQVKDDHQTYLEPKNIHKSMAQERRQLLMKLFLLTNNHDEL